MKSLAPTILLSLFIILSCTSERTDTQEGRISQEIDLNWRFYLGDSSDYHEPGFNDSEWEIVSLPHDWMITQPVNAENPSSTPGAFYPEGIAWYRKHLDLREFEDKSQFYLVFDGVYMNSEVWINGRYLGKHKYGYIGFHYDISAYLHFDQENIIAVKTDCSTLPADRWYPGAGIYRHVRLVATDKLHFPLNSLRVTQSKQGDSFRLNTNLKVRNADTKRRKYRLKTEILDKDGKVLHSEEHKRSIAGGGTTEIEKYIDISHPELWSPENPVLYTLSTSIIHKNEILDQQRLAIGFREAVFSPDSGFSLNGSKYMLKGVCIHHDGGELGSAVPYASYEKRLKTLKSLGVNAVRLAHNPHAPEVLDICDRIGILVIDEMYDKWELPWDGQEENFDFTNTWKEDLEYFIYRDINHPSVILWSVGNETMEQLKEPEMGKKIYRNLLSHVTAIDPSRKVSCGLHPGSGDGTTENPSSYIDVSDIVSYNYRTDSFPSWHQQYPDKVWIATETKAYLEFDVSLFEDISYLDNSWFDMDSFVAGQFIWAGIDYLGETRGWPDRIFRNGLLMSNGFIKPYAYYTQSIYSNEPMVKLVVVDQNLKDSLINYTSWQKSWAGAPVVRHWNFREREQLQVLAYTNCDSIRILLNAEEICSMRKRDFDDGVIKFSMKYHPGVLSAEAFGAEGVCVHDTLKTSISPSKIMMEPDKEFLLADGKDVVHIETRVTDEEGVTFPMASNEISYTLQGPGKLKVIDNGIYDDHTRFHSNSKRVKFGKHLVILQSTVEPGDLIISASGKGLKPAQLTVESKALQE